MPATLRNPAGNWLRTGTTLNPIIAGDNVETTGHGQFGSLDVTGRDFSVTTASDPGSAVRFINISALDRSITLDGVGAWTWTAPVGLSINTGGTTLFTTSTHYPISTASDLGGSGTKRWRDLWLSRNLSVDSPTLVVDAANHRVGIGTATPATHLEVSGTGTQIIRVTSTDHISAGIEFKRAGDIYADWKIIDDGGILKTQYSMNDGATWTDNMFFVSNGIRTSGTNRFQFRDTGLYIYSSIDGQLDLVADGLIKLWQDVEVTGKISSGTATLAAAGPTDNVDASSINTLFLDCSSNAVVIGGFVGGVDGQVLHLARLCAAANNATLEHNEGTGNQDIFLHAGADETLTGEYGGWTLVCNGTSWFDLSHAKHV